MITLLVLGTLALGIGSGVALYVVENVSPTDMRLALMRARVTSNK